MNNIVSNIIGNVMTNPLGAELQSPQDLKDYGFSQILDNKLIEIKSEGIPEAINILDLYNMHSDAAESINTNRIEEMTTSEVITFSESLFDSSTLPERNNSIYDFSRKNATNFYGRCAKNIAMDLEEFVSDTLNLK